MSNVASFGQSNPYPCGVVMSSGSMAVAQNSIPWNNPNPMQGLDPTVTSYHSNLQPMQQTPLPKRQLHHPLWNTNFQSAPNNRDNLPQVSQQLSNHGSRQHRGQHSQNLYPGQLQNQDRLLPNLTQRAMALAAPVMHVPSKQVNEDCGQTSSNTVLRWIPFMFHARHCKAKKDKCASKFCFQARKIVKHIDCC